MNKLEAAENLVRFVSENIDTYSFHTNKMMENFLSDYNNADNVIDLSEWLYSAMLSIELYSDLQSMYDKHVGLEHWFENKKAEAYKKDQIDKERALAKLTAREKILLGIK